MTDIPTQRSITASHALEISSRYLPYIKITATAPHPHLLTADEAEALAEALMIKARELREANKPKPKYVSFENSFITDPNHLPFGYDTIVGYMAKNFPDDLRSLRDPVADTARDGFHCKHQCLRHGIAVRPVSAPAALRARGITTVNAYPIGVLERRLGN